MSNNANNTNTINNVQNIKEDNAMNAMNTQNTMNTQNNIKEENAMKVITEANEIMKVFAEMCEANCRYAEDNERDEPYGTFTFGFNDREVHVCTETTLMVGLGDALEILTHVSEQRLIGTSIKLDELDRNGRDTVDVYNFIAWLYTRLYHGDTPVTKLTFTGGQYTLQIEEEPERMKLALMQLCYRVADENGCRNVMQFIAKYSDIYHSVQIDDRYSVLYAYFDIDTFQSFENMFIPCGIFSIAEENMEECQYNLFSAIETMFDWSSQFEICKKPSMAGDRYAFNGVNYKPIFNGGVENMLIAYENSKPVRCMFFTTASNDAFERDKAIRIEIANDYIRQLKSIIPEALIEEMPRLPEMLLMFERLHKKASYKAPEKWELYAANKALHNMLEAIYNIWRTAVPKATDEEGLEEFNDRHVWVTDTNGASACLSTSPTLCEDLVNLAMHLYDEL